MRRGEEAAFRAVAEPLQPVLRRLAALSTRSPGEGDALVTRSWSLALGGLDMFRWHTPLATWVAGITVSLGRVHAARGPRPLPAAPRPASSLPGPADWSDLPWGGRWQHAWPTLTATLAALPLAQREALHARCTEQWPLRRVCDVLGLAVVTAEQLLARGQGSLCDALAATVGDVGPHPPARGAAVGGMLELLLDPADGPLDPRSVAVFRRWSRRGRRLALTSWRRGPG